MKSIMISIKPKYCELIANGKKTVEVRKTKPKLDVPFKVYIYATQPKKWFRFSSFGYASEESLWLSNGKVKMCDGFEFWVDKTEYCCLNGKVIGEFVCDRIVDIPYSQYFVDYYHTMPQEDLEATCLCMGHIDEYLLNRNGYGWHITDLVIYDKPKELWNFKKECVGYVRNDEDCCFETCPEYDLGGCDGRYKPIYTPPMSWMFVEELGV